MHPSKITTTVGLNIGQIELGGSKLSFWDLGGQQELQSLWDKVWFCKFLNSIEELCRSIPLFCITLIYSVIYEEEIMLQNKVFSFFIILTTFNKIYYILLLFLFINKIFKNNHLNSN